MDVAETQIWFDRWLTAHSESCDADHLRVSKEQQGRQTIIKLECPVCNRAVRGNIVSDDWAAIFERLGPKATT